jgi:hypothetical protein
MKWQKPFTPVQPSQIHADQRKYSLQIEGVFRKNVFICIEQFLPNNQTKKNEKKPNPFNNSRNGSCRFHALGFYCAKRNSFFTPTDSIFGTTLISTTLSTD